jgi:ribosomal protein S18 acetylase RimI-like enzyme
MLPLHRQFEECAFRALPSLHTECHDGWVIRLAAGGPKRANSVNVLDASTRPLTHKIERCERLFLGHGIAPTFRLTHHDVDAGLDGLLDARGYRRQDESVVMARKLDGFDTAGASCAFLEADEWLALLLQIDQGTPERKRKHVELLRGLAQPALFGAVKTGGQHVAMGLAVIDGMYVGLFDIATLPEARRAGHARTVTQALLRRASESGAQMVYLQVLAQNHAALSLYASLGFGECYRYWYRVLPDTEHGKGAAALSQAGA